MIKRQLDLQKVLGKNGSTFLFGARGTGKTVLAHALLQQHKKHMAVELLEQKTFLRYLHRPGILREEVEAVLPPKKSEPLLILIDEVQKVPALLDEVHSLFNDYPGRLQFLLTGSSTMAKTTSAEPIWK
jgi:predicted AAA+ superfamily ATPase